MPATQMDQTLADQLVDHAIHLCADLKFSGDDQRTRQALRLGRCDVCVAVSQCLVRQVSEYLGRLDRTVKAVYQYEPEITSLRQGASALHPAGINLVAWVERKSAALIALSGTLENVLSESRKRIHCTEADQACYILDIQMVDDHDVQERRGLGMLVHSQFLRSVQVWEREKPAPGNGNGRNGRDQALPEILRASFDTEFSPESALFEQAMAIENLPEEEKTGYTHRLREVKVALIRRLISDQLAYINIAKDWFTIADLAAIYSHKIGNGRIGGKAAGMLLAHRILQENLDEETRAAVQAPESFYVGSDVLYLFMAMNGLMHWNNQKYKSEDQIRSEYPRIQSEFERGEFPPEIQEELGVMLEQIGKQPVIVRSSSLLEDNFGTSFAGKYQSVFLPNQADFQTNLNALTRAIARIYGSTLKPDALLYRRSKGLQDYDERMAILVQGVQGERYGRYFFPLAAGVAFSRNLYRWSPLIRKTDGFVRLVWGLGTRAVERVGADYPRLVALSHPTLQPDDSPEAVRYYSQRNVDLIDLEDNCFTSLPVHEVIRPDYPTLRFLAQVEEDGYFSTPRGRILHADVPRLAITFDEFLRRTPFADTLARILRVLEERYRVPVDVEFTASLTAAAGPKPGVRISLLQCRPQSTLQDYLVRVQARAYSAADVIFRTGFMVPHGMVTGIRYLVYVSPDEYFSLPTQAARNELRGLISRLNQALPEKSFICLGPGRWGTLSPDLGVLVGYADIHHAAALVELSGPGIGPAPDPSLGTHFFQDLMEANIYPLAVCLDQSDTTLNTTFFEDQPNQLADLLPGSLPGAAACLRVIDVEASRPGWRLELVMDADEGRAVAYLAPPEAS